MEHYEERLRQGYSIVINQLVLAGVENSCLFPGRGGMSPGFKELNPTEEASCTDTQVLRHCGTASRWRAIQYLTGQHHDIEI